MIKPFMGLMGTLLTFAGEIHSSLARLIGRSKVGGYRAAAMELAESQSILFNGWICHCMLTGDSLRD